MPTDRRTALYNTLIQSGEEIGSLEDFLTVINSEKSVNLLYDNLLESGSFTKKTLGNRQDFVNLLKPDFADMPKPTGEPKVTKEEIRKENEKDGILLSLWNKFSSGVVRSVAGMVESARPFAGYTMSAPGMGPSRRVEVYDKEKKTMRPMTDKEIKVAQKYVTEVATQIYEKADEIVANVETFDKNIYDSFKTGNWADAGKQIAFGVSESTGYMLPMILGRRLGGGAQAGILPVGISSAGQNAVEMRKEIKTGKRKYTEKEILETSLAFGGFEIVGDIFAAGMLNGAGRIFKQALNRGGKEALEQTTRSTVKEGLKMLGQEPMGEVITQVGQNWSRKTISGQNVDITDGLADAAILGLAFGAKSMGGSYIAGKALNKVMSVTDKMTIRKNNRQLYELQQIRNNPNTTDEAKANIETMQKGLLQQNADIIEKNKRMARQMTYEERQDMVEYSNQIQAADDILSDPSISPEQRSTVMETRRNAENQRQNLLNIVIDRITEDVKAKEKEDAKEGKKPVTDTKPPKPTEDAEEIRTEAEEPMQEEGVQQEEMQPVRVRDDAEAGMEAEPGEEVGETTYQKVKTVKAKRKKVVGETVRALKAVGIKLKGEAGAAVRNFQTELVNRIKKTPTLYQEISDYTKTGFRRRGEFLKNASTEFKELMGFVDSMIEGKKGDTERSYLLRKGMDTLKVETEKAVGEIKKDITPGELTPEEAEAQRIADMEGEIEAARMLKEAGEITPSEYRERKKEIQKAYAKAKPEVTITKTRDKTKPQDIEGTTASDWTNLKQKVRKQLTGVNMKTKKGKAAVGEALKEIEAFYQKNKGRLDKAQQKKVEKYLKEPIETKRDLSLLYRRLGREFVPKQRQMVGVWGQYKRELQLGQRVSKASEKQARANIKEIVGRLREFARTYKTRLTDSQHRGILNRLSKEITTEGQLTETMEYIDKVMADAGYADRLLKTEKIRTNLLKKIRTAEFKKNFRGQLDKIAAFANIKPGQLNPEQLETYESVAEDIMDGRLSGQIDKFVRQYQKVEPELTPYEQMVEGLKRVVDFSANLIKVQAEIREVKKPQDLLRISDRLNAYRRKAAELYLNEDLNESDYEEIIFDIQKIENRKLTEAEVEMKKQLIGDINRNKRLVDPNNYKEGVRESVNELKNLTDAEVADMELHTVIDLSNAMYNLTQGNVTRQVFSAIDQVRIKRVKDGVKRFKEDFSEARTKHWTVRRMAKKKNRLLKKLNLKNAYLLDYTFGTEKNREVFVSMFQPVATAEARSERKKREVTREFNVAMNSLRKFKTGGSIQRSVDAIGLLLDEMQYRSNKIAVRKGEEGITGKVDMKWDEVPQEYKNKIDFLLKEKETTLGDEDLYDRYKKAKKEFVYDSDGIIDIKATYDNFSKAEKKVFDSARRLFKSLEGLNEANTIRRGQPPVNIPNYLPQYVKGKATKGGIEAQTNELNAMTQSPYALGKVAGSVYEKSFEVNFIEPDIGKIVSRYTNDLVNDYYINTAYKQVMGGLESGRVDAGIQKDKATYNALTAIKETLRDRAVNAYAQKQLFDNIFVDKEGKATDFEKRARLYSRNAMLANPARVPAELTSNIVGAYLDGAMRPGIPITPAEQAKWNILLNDLGSPMTQKVNKYVEMKEGAERSRAQKVVDAMIQFSDNAISKPIYRRAFKKRFKELTGQKFSIDEYLGDNNYSEQFSDAIREASSFGDIAVQEEFNTMTRIGEAPETKLFFFFPNISKKNIVARNFSFMSSFATQEAAMFKVALTEISRGNISRGASILVSRVARNFVYTAMRRAGRKGYYALAGIDVDWEEFEDVKSYKNDVLNAVGALFLGRHANIFRPVAGWMLYAAGEFEKEMTGKKKTPMTDDVEDFLYGVDYVRRFRKYDTLPNLMSYILPAQAVVIQDLFFVGDEMVKIGTRLAKGESVTPDEKSKYYQVIALFEMMNYLVPNPLSAPGKQIFQQKLRGVKKKPKTIQVQG